jgi:hypothetical protein
MFSFLVVDAKGGKVLGTKAMKKISNTNNLKVLILQVVLVFWSIIGSKWIMELGEAKVHNLTLRGHSCILASRLYIFIQMFVIFACFGCVVINYQKGGDCKENRPRAIWLNRFWCLMINITCGLMCLLVFVFAVHRMLKLLGKALRKETPQKKTLWRSQLKIKKYQASPRNEDKCCQTDCPCRGHRNVRWHTGLSGATCRTVRCAREQ